MSRPTPDQWAELDSSDIASINSDDLNTHRPNRWQGAESTWRALTEEERSLWSSLRTRENQDLSTHLYNAFALKQRSKDPALAEDLKVETEDGSEAIWAPPKIWTAWPLAEGKLPNEDFVARKQDEDEDCTFRKKGDKMPSDDLQEEISATILRIAKKRFLKRKKGWSAMQASVEEEDESMKEETEAESAEEDEMEVDEKEGDNESNYGSEASTWKPTKTYEPVVSADEELSSKLLEPSSRHIIAKLDSTLQILHHTRVNMTRANGGDGSDFDASESEATDKEDSMIDTDALEPRLKVTKRGRPRKAQVPRDGESREQMLVRIAREGHRRVPKLSKEEAAAKRDAEAGEAKEQADAAFNAWMDEQDGSGSSEHKGNDPDDSGEETSGQRKVHEAKNEAFEEWLREDEDKKITQRPRRQRVALRDWSDVLGVAAIAGFPADVIARTTQRCANIFGGSMSIRNLQEVPHQQRGTKLEEYRPEAIHLSDSDEAAPESEAEMTLDERRTLSRRNSRIQSRASSSPSPTRSRSQSRSRSGSRAARSRSTSSAPINYCPVQGCERSTAGFNRRSNLRRHMKLVHKGMVLDESASSAQSGSEVDSDDQVLGAVHVDGFLKPVVPSKGWRGEDMETRKRKHGWQKRRREEETDDTTADASA